MTFTVWLTGLSGSGKTTIANKLSEFLKQKGIKHEIIDGTEFRDYLGQELSYSPEHRNLFRKRLIEIGKLLQRNEISLIMPLLSSSKSSREHARNELANFIEVYVKCPYDVCEKRDVLGHYKKINEGKIKDFVGKNINYEEPLNPEVVVETDKESVEESTAKVIDYLQKKGLL